MMRIKLKLSKAGLISTVLCAAMLTGCATTTPYDYTAFKQSNPHSILILPPVNDTTSVEATYGMLAQMTMPLAESGYYVLPVTLVDETFKQNGLTSPVDIENVSSAKLLEIFGADAALHVHIKQYGTVYVLINSATVVTAEAKLVDLRTGTLLWSGQASASSAEQRSSSGGGIVGLLVAAIVNQIIESSMDQSQKEAAIASNRLLSAGRPSGILYGPRSPNYQKEQQL